MVEDKDGTMAEGMAPAVGCKLKTNEDEGSSQLGDPSFLRLMWLEFDDV